MTFGRAMTSGPWPGTRAAPRWSHLDEAGTRVMSMRWMVLGAAGLVLAFAAEAWAGPAQGFGNDETGCSIDSDYTIRVDDSGIRLDADDEARDAPRRIEIRDGRLRVDGKARGVSAADARRLREVEAGTRAMLPEIAAITREAVGIAFDSLALVNQALTGNRQARDFERLRTRSLARVDDTLGRGVWTPDAFGPAFEAEIEAAAEAMAASFSTPRALWMVMTGGFGRMERRMEKMEAELERSVEARAAKLERHAAALCRRLESLHRLQDAMDLRLEDGRPLRVFQYRPRGEGEGSGVQVTAR